MKVPTKTTLLIGNKGFTFIEVMVALVVLSVGIIAVYRSFFLCVDYLNNTATRWWANELMEAKIADLSNQYQSQTTGLPSIPENTINVTVNHRSIGYRFAVTLTPKEGLDKLVQAHVDLNWHDGRRPMHLERNAYLLR